MPSAPVFTPQAFDLLAAIARTPTAAFYLSNKAAFKEWVEAPLQGLLRRAALRLPGMFRAKMETERNLFSRFLKNDFGRGGAWSNYWGAFYPKGSRRVADVQLSVWVNATRVGISFYIGDYGTGPRDRFRRNCARSLHVLPGLLRPLVENPRILLPGGGRTRLDEEGYLLAEDPLTWQDWLADPARADYWALAAYRPLDVLAMPGDALEEQVARLHADYFPLALLAIEDDPLPLIVAYLA